MEVDINWFAILGFAFGLAAVLRWIYQDIAGYASKPRLVISHGPFAINWQSIDTEETRRYIHFEVTSKKGIARHCLAQVTILDHPPEVTILQRELPLHWADTPYGAMNTETEPVDIRTEAKRLDIAFSSSNHTGMSWLATPLALASPNKVPQATIPPGEYTLEITVSCENGRGDTKIIKLISLPDWQELRAEPITPVD